MNHPISKRIAIAIGVLMFLEIALQTTAVLILGKNFEFPDVLRRPANEVLELFYVNQQSVVSGYYLFLLSSILYIPLTALLAGNMSERINQKSTWKIMLISSGLATTIFQSIGFSRWIFIVPVLANQYMQPEATRMIQQNIEMNYTLLNTYLGMTIGEHLGFIAMALWTISVAMILPFHKLYKWFGIVISLILLVSLAENFGDRYAPLFGQLNFIVNSLWSLWLLTLSIKFFSERIFTNVTNSNLTKAAPYITSL